MHDIAPHCTSRIGNLKICNCGRRSLLGAGTPWPTPADHASWLQGQGSPGDMRAMFRQQRAAMLPNNELCEWEWHLGNHLQTPSMHALPMPLEVRDPLT